jgi:hypothetical protein
MSEPFTIMFIFAGVIAIGAVVFGIWLMITLLRLAGRAFSSVFRFDAGGSRMLLPTRRCLRDGCRAVNPSSARFCRRCGHQLIGTGSGCGTTSW